MSDMQRVQYVQTPWLTVAQAAKYCHMRKPDMQRLVASGKIESRRRGERGRFIHTSWLDEYMMGLPSGAMVPEVLRAVM